MTSSERLLNIPVYDDDPDAVSRLVSRQYSPLKLVLKIKNDPIFLKDWLEYHGRIVGFDNIVIADNMSDDQDLLDIYQDYAGRFPIFRFSGLHNLLHQERNFPRFYQALYDSSEYFQIIDADERLIALRDDHVLNDDRVLSVLSEAAGSSLILGVAFLNVAGRGDTFAVNMRDIARPLWVGKSIFSSAFRRTLPAGRQVNHNREIAGLGTHLRETCKTRIALLHLTKLNYAQRMRTNREKLVARKLVSPDASYEEIARLEFDADHLKAFVSQIREGLRQLAGQASERPEASDQLARNNFRIGLNGSIAFGSEDMRRSYLRIVNEPAAILFPAEASQGGVDAR